MLREDHDVGAAMPGRPTREDRRDYTANRSQSPEVPIVDDPQIVAVVERASDLDRAWFWRHPRRAYRLRPTLHGEFAGVTYPAARLRLTLVKQLLRGTRLRYPLYARRHPCSCETCLAELWEAISPTHVKEIALDVAAAVLRCGQ